jgi:hypothetical protein
MPSGPQQPRKISRSEAVSLLKAADLDIGPSTGGTFEVWLTKDGYPQNLFYAGSPDYFWYHEVMDAIADAKRRR